MIALSNITLSNIGMGDGIRVLVEAFWKSSVVLGATLCACTLLCKKSADVRRRLLAAAVILLFVAALAAPVLPLWNVPAPAWFPPSPVPPAAGQSRSMTMSDTATEPLPATDRPAAPRQHQSLFESLARLPGRVPAIPLIWFTGAAILLGRFLVGLHRLRRIGMASHALSNGEMLAYLDSPGRRHISLLESEAIAAPVTWGVVRPVILLPAGFRQLPADHQRQVLCHELAHIQGLDFLLRVLTEILAAAIWFQPLVWITRRQLREEQELACDDRVLAAGGKSSAYAKLLLDWNDSLSHSDALAAIGMAQRNCLKRRLYALLDLDTRRARVSGPATAATWFLGVAMAIPLAAVGFTHEPAPVRPVAAAAEPDAVERQPPAPSDAAPQIAAAHTAPADEPQPVHSPAPASQSQENRYEFEAVSIKPAPPDDRFSINGGPGTTDPGQFVGTKIGLRWLLGTAFPDPYDIAGPDWLDKDRYDVTAKVPPGTTKDQFQRMVRSMLEDRATLRVHHETREFPSYDLVVAKGGAKLTEAKDEPEAQAPGANPPAGQRNKVEAGGPPIPILTRPGIFIFNFISPSGEALSRMVSKAQPISSVAATLRSAVHAYVADKTGLAGEYDFKLEFAFDSLSTASPDGASPPAPSIFVAIKDLGLELHKTKAMLDVLVIDHIDRVLKPN